ncbi:P-loop containing nucleoside triphosphate hydrolase protein [Xylaria venustula]|nr:P-loop containing nucleoside triphosphate hydrolase protein [Xylaria venustula]
MDPLTGNPSSNAKAERPSRLGDVLAELDAPELNNTVEVENTNSRNGDFITSQPGIEKVLRLNRLVEELKPASQATDSIRYKSLALYNHFPDSKQRIVKWSEFPNLSKEEKRIKEMSKAFVVIHRRSKIEKDGNEAWITHSIEAQSPQLRILLNAVFDEYPQWYPDATPYAVSPPFKPFVHRWDRILELRKQQDSEAIKQLELLCNELEQPIATHLSALEGVKKTQTISFESLWLILAPGCLMVSKENGDTIVSRLLNAEFVAARESHPAFWLLRVSQLNWNGSHFGFEVGAERITEYNDSIFITKLPTYPIEFAPDRREIEENLLARGRKFETLCGFHIKTCTGKKYVRKYIPARGCYGEEENPVSGRIIVDAYAYHQVQNQVAPNLFRLDRSRQAFESSSQVYESMAEDKHRRRSSRSSLSSSSSSSSGSDNTEHDDIDERDKYQHRNMNRNEDIVPLTDLECVLAVPRVNGFDLIAKEWCKFNVDDIQDVEWDEAPYNNLVLPEGERDLVMAFADHPRRSTRGFDDFVAHKGEGIIILLCGPAGVGKTLTAEAVAEKSHIPLYILSASDLGTSPSKVDAGLMKALECCQLWDAVLLLDEADVYLEARDSNSLARNELVSIFLRRLEYYQGLMFLTTNRINSIDPAFKSRLDLILPYYDLDEPSRRKVWVNFMQKLSPEIASISESDFDQLAKAQVNGREIKNLIKTALVLSKRDKPMRLKHLITVIDIRKRVESLK